MNESPYVGTREMKVAQVFSIFRGLGLRHLPILEHDGRIAAIITRHDLTGTIHDTSYYHTRDEIRHGKKNLLVKVY